MKTLNIALVLLIIVGCDRTEDLPDYELNDGLYVGCFYYQDIRHGYGIMLENEKYRESLFGGLYYQKYCITEGTYSVEGRKLVFFHDSSMGYYDTLRYPCNQENWLLPGEYSINYLEDDSLVFERGEGDSRIIYHIKKEADAAQIVN